MSEVDEQTTVALTLGELWKAIKKARHNHPSMDVVLLTMHPRDLYDLRFEDRAMSVVQFDMVRDCWTAFGVPIKEGRFTGADKDRLIVLRPRRLSHFRSISAVAEIDRVAVDNLTRTITEAF